MQFRVLFYETESGEQPMVDFIADLQRKTPKLATLVLAGIRKLQDSGYHGPPLTEYADKANGILELRVGSADIARVFFFFQRGQEIILTNGYVKKQQKLNTNELKKAQKYKENWERRYP